MPPKVEVVKYNPDWPQIFQQLRAVISAVLGELALRIEHVGSTSVPGLDAKPKIDLDVVIASRRLLPEVIQRLETLGYQHAGDLDVPGREAFLRLSENVPVDGTRRSWTSHNLYVCDRHCAALAEHLSFRDYLRNNPNDAKEYAELKHRLASQFPDDINFYWQAKTDFIKDRLKKMQQPESGWFADESFWSGLYSFMFPDRAFVQAEEQTDKILKLTGITKGHVLDLCCGPGRHAIPLAKRGFEVTGVDRSAFLLQKARERANQANMNVEWVFSDMREFSRPNSYDLVLNFFTSFGYFENKQDDLKVLQLVYQNLKAGGVFFLDMISKEWLARNYQSEITTKLEDGSVLLQRNQVVDDWTRMKNQWTLTKDGHEQSFAFSDRIYSGQEMKDLLSAAGFSNVRLFGDLDGSPYDIDVKRLIAVAKK
jgi:GrpB-like predicted nucleotidyltransferase (UPF0157 family)/SAM-dependent methyltransferase